ncbi:importin-4 isoform X2 [Phaenicophaeus curvirostris]|uniref:importin-4 isoform X2 n=1 Tax=Phaenicophaeus curvirostris TaxID=33595 RepID=UPI0037F0D050
MAELEALLRALLEPDTAGLRRATLSLREALKDPETPTRLAGLLRDAPQPQVRQMAAVVLRRCLLGRWRGSDPELRGRLPSLVAEALDAETEHAVTVALAQLGALVLRRGGEGAWGPLGNWVTAAVQDPRPPRRETALLVLSAALDAAPEPLAPHAPAVAALCRGALAFGGPPPTLAYGLRALGGLAATVGDTRTELLRGLLPEILTALKLLLDGDEDRGAEALEVLDEFLEADPAAVTPHLRALLDLCLQVAGDKGRGDAVRVRALDTLTFLAQKSPKAVLRGGLLPALLEGLTSPLGDSDTPRNAAARVLDALAVGLPPEKLLPQLVPVLGGMWGSAGGGARQGALLALGALGGAGTLLRQRYLSLALGVLQGGLGDPEPGVRGAAASALRSLEENLQPEVQAVAEAALPGALSALGAAGGDRTSWFVLESLVECLGEALGPQLPAVLGPILASLEPSGPPETLELALSALHSLAASGAELGEQAGPILGALTPLLQPGPPESRPLRLQALGVVGALGRAAAEALVPALDLALSLAREEEEEDEGETLARRAALALAGAGAEALGASLAPLLPRVVPLLLGALGQPPPTAGGEGQDPLLLFEEEEEGAEPMDGDVIEEEELIEVELGGAWAEELVEACEALGGLAEHCGAAFAPFAPPCLEALLALSQLPDPVPRAASYEALGSLVGLFAGSGGAPTSPGPLERVLRALLEAARREPGAAGAAAALEALGKGLGPQTPTGIREHAARLLADTVLGKLPCQKDASEEEEDLLVLAGDGLVALGVGEELVLELLPALVDGLSPARSRCRRCWASGVLALLCPTLGGRGGALAGPALAAAASDPEGDVRANGLCGIGRLAHTWPPGRALVLRALAAEGPGRARDNACSVLVRNWEHWESPEALGLLVRALPVAHDLEEEAPVLEGLVRLHQRLPHTLWPHAAELPRACADAVGSGRLGPGLCRKLTPTSGVTSRRRGRAGQ